MKNIIKKIFKFRKYSTPPIIRQELIELLKWSNPGKTDDEYNNILDSYFESNDISYYGDLRKMHGTNTRNQTSEHILVFCMIILSVLFSTAIIKYFL